MRKPVRRPTFLLVLPFLIVIDLAKRIIFYVRYRFGRRFGWRPWSVEDELETARNELREWWWFVDVMNGKRHWTGRIFDDRDE